MIIISSHYLSYFDASLQFVYVFIKFTLKFALFSPLSFENFGAGVFKIGPQTFQFFIFSSPERLLRLFSLLFFWLLLLSLCLFIIFLNKQSNLWKCHTYKSSLEYNGGQKRKFKNIYMIMIPFINITYIYKAFYHEEREKHTFLSSSFFGIFL